MLLLLHQSFKAKTKNKRVIFHQLSANQTKTSLLLYSPYYTKACNELAVLISAS